MSGSLPWVSSLSSTQLVNGFSAAWWQKRTLEKLGLEEVGGDVAGGDRSMQADIAELFEAQAKAVYGVELELTRTMQTEDVLPMMFRPAASTDRPMRIHPNGQPASAESQRLSAN